MSQAPAASICSPRPVTTMPAANSGPVHPPKPAARLHDKYDALGRLTHTYYECPNSNTDSTTFTKTNYDSQGRREITWDEEGIGTRYYYNSLGQTTGTSLGYKSAGEPGVLFGFTPDSQGRVGMITNSKGQTRLKIYDNKGRLSREYGHLCDQSTSSLVVKMAPDRS